MSRWIRRQPSEPAPEADAALRRLQRHSPPVSGTDLSAHSAARLAVVATELSDRPRRTHGWTTPATLFQRVHHQRSWAVTHNLYTTGIAEMRMSQYWHYWPAGWSSVPALPPSGPGDSRFGGVCSGGGGWHQTTMDVRNVIASSRSQLMRLRRGGFLGFL